MSAVDVFDSNALRYDEWFERHRTVYESEIEAIKRVMPPFDDAIEVGIGTGRFAIPLGIRMGVEPSEGMAAIARFRGLEVINARGEELPFDDESFDLVLMVTTICFLDDPQRALHEAWRVLRPEGHVVLGFVDASSPIGRYYDEHREESTFYAAAKFFTVDAVIGMLSDAHFGKFRIAQTLFHYLDEITTVEPVEDGYGRGSFIAISAAKQPSGNA